MFTPLSTHRAPMTATRALRVAATAAVVSATALAASATGAGATSAPRTVTVAPIRETFSHQACPARPSTTVALEACGGDRVLALDQRIDRLDDVIVGRLPTGGQRQFVSATRQWVEYRNLIAKAAAAPDAGGTIAPLVVLGALASEDRAHISALEQEFTSADGQRP